MHRNYFLIIVAVAIFCLVLIFFSFWWEIRTPITQVSTAPSPYTPFTTSISGVGIVEPSSEKISIGAPLQRIIKKVYVKKGEKVKKGTPLFLLEDRDLKADLKAQQAAFNSALAKLRKLEAYPRPEDLSAAAANVTSAKTEYELAKKQYDRVLDLPDPRAVSQQEKDTRLSRFKKAEANLEQAQAELKKVQKGTWRPDLEIARHEVERARASIHQIQAKISQTLVCAPIDGTILQLKIHEGELPSLDSFKPLMVLGNTDKKYLRVSINQLDIPLFNKDAPAKAFPQGKPDEAYTLKFVSLEPLLVSKKNLTNEISETVDTRVLQIIYLIEEEDPKLFVGQQMDVYIETEDGPKE